MSRGEPRPPTALERVEVGRPSGLWEGHLADGRAQALHRLLAWMEPLGGLTVIDAGCGHGTVAVELARRGARVLACDLRLDRAISARRRARACDARVAVAVADVADAVSASESHTWLCWELLEHLAPDRRGALLAAVEASRATRLFLAARVESRLGSVIGRWSGADGERLGPRMPATLELTPLLRRIHLDTGLRLVRTETVTRRHGAIALAQLDRPEPGD